MTAKKKTFWDEVIHISKAVGASILIIGTLTSLAWSLKGEELVDNRIHVQMSDHKKTLEPWVSQINSNTGDIVQIKSNQLLISCKLDQLLTDAEIERAERKHREIERLQ